MTRLLFAAVAFLTLSSGSASLLDWVKTSGDETVEVVEAVKVEKVEGVKARSLATKFTPAPTRRIIPTAAPVPKPTRAPIPPVDQPINRITPSPISRFTQPPNAANCIVPESNLYECGDTIRATFNYASRTPKGLPRINDRIAIYPCYITSFKQAEVWQWACGGPPLTPQTCTGPRASGTVVFNRKPAYNGANAVWPISPNLRPDIKAVNRCFKLVIIRSDGQPYTQYCNSTRITINENSRQGCGYRLTSPTDP